MSDFVLVTQQVDVVHPHVCVCACVSFGFVSLHIAYSHTLIDASDNSLFRGLFERRRRNVVIPVTTAQQRVT